ncbi:MAG: BppU family phage baseplate upper protein [Lachnospiraceae bacterium]
MEAIIKRNVRVTTKDYQEPIDVVQSDSGRVLAIYIMDMDIPSGATATIYANKPDKTRVFNNCTISGQTVLIRLTTQMLAAVGELQCQFQIIYSSDIVKTFQININVHKSLIDSTSIESGDEFGALTDALKTVTGLQDGIDTANERIDSANGRIDVISEDFENLQKKIPENPFLETADVEPYAQSIIDNVGLGGYAAQGMAIGTWGGSNYMLCCHVDGTTLTGTNLTLYDMTTGKVAAQKNGLELNHANGVTFCTKDNCFYIAPDGGTAGTLNKICVVDSNLNLVKTISISGYSTPYGIAWNEVNSRFYVTVNNRQIVECDYGFNVLRVLANPNLSSEEYVEQSIATDGQWLYVINNGLSYNYPLRYWNKVDVYTLTMDYYASVMVPVSRELESMAFIDGECYFAFNTQTSGLIFKGTLENSNILYQHRHNRAMNLDIKTTENVLTVWLDSTATQFHCDGTVDKPFNRFYNYNILMKDSFTDINVNMIGDYSDKNINVKGAGVAQRFFFTGYSNKTTQGNASIGGIYFRNMDSVFLNNLVVTKRNEMQNDLVSLMYCNYACLTNVTLRGAGTETYGLRSIATDTVLIDCTFDSSFTTYLMRVREGGSLLLDSTETTVSDNATNDYSVETVFNTIWNQPLWVLYRANSQNSPLTKTIGYNANWNGGDIDLLKIVQPGIYQFAQEISPLNRPSGTSGRCTVIVENLGTVFYMIKYYDSSGAEYHMRVNRSGTNSGWVQ